MDRTLCLGLYSLVLVATLLHPGYSLSDDDFNLVSNISKLVINFSVESQLFRAYKLLAEV